MKNATPKKASSPAKKVSLQKPAATAAATQQTVHKQPQSKQQGAVEAGIFLHTDDQWSLAYFDSGDLHCEERELFG